MCRAGEHLVVHLQCYLDKSTIASALRYCHLRESTGRHVCFKGRGIFQPPFKIHVSAVVWVGGGVASGCLAQNHSDRIYSYYSIVILCPRDRRAYHWMSTYRRALLIFPITYFQVLELERFPLLENSQPWSKNQLTCGLLKCPWATNIGSPPARTLLYFSWKCIEI